MRYLPRGSALSQELEPSTPTELWLDGSAVAPLIADLIDAVNAQTSALMAKGTGKKPKFMDPHWRPWVRPKGERKVGRGAIPIDKFEEWWSRRR